MNILRTVTIAVLVICGAVEAVPPPPPQQGVFGRNVTVGLSTLRIYVAPACDPSIPWDLGGVAVTTATPTDSLSVHEAARAFNNGMPGNQVFPVELRADGVYWMTHAAGGRLDSQGGLVGFSPRPIEMANQLLPTGAELALLREKAARYYERRSLDQVEGEVSVRVIYARPSDGLDFTVQGQPAAWQSWDSLIFGPTPTMSPGGQLNHESHAEYISRATNGHVSVVRGAGTTLPGTVNLIANGEVQFFELPYTTEELQGRVYGDPWRDLLMPQLAAAGYDVSSDPYDVIILVWMVDMDEVAWAGGLWPQSELGSGWLQVCSHFRGDQAPQGTTSHEFAHGSFSLDDTYWPLSIGYTGPWDPMSNAVWNNEGRWIPRFSGPDSWDWFEGTTAASPGQVGRYSLADGEYVRFMNPLSASDAERPEWVCVSAIDPAAQGLPDESGTRIIVWKTWTYAVCEYG